MQIKQKILARRYALAFLNTYFVSLKKTDLQGIIDLRDFFKKRRRACFLMRLSLLDDTVKCNALDAIVKEFNVSVCFQKIIHLLIAHKRTLLLEDVFGEIYNEYKDRKGLITFTVTSAGKMSDQQKNKIENFLKDITQKAVACSYQEDQSLIAGVRLQSDQLLWETSIKDRLNNVTSMLKR